MILRAALGPLRRWLWSFIWPLSLALFLAIEIYTAFEVWPDARGYENVRIARNLSQGHGFSFEGSARWLFDPTDDGDYYPTAWKEPVYPFVLSVFFRLFGEQYGMLAMLLAHALCFTGTFVLAYHIGRLIAGRAAGITGAALFALLLNYHKLALHPLESVHYLFGNAAFAGFLIASCALLLIRLLDSPSPRTSSILGLSIGLTALTYGATILFAPTAIISLATSGTVSRSGVWKHSLWMLLGTVLVISPWAVRNYLMFHHLVLVRNGTGQVIHLGNLALAYTLDPTLTASPEKEPPPWTANGPNQALNQLRHTGKRRALEKYAKVVVESDAPADYAGYNETERDKVYLAQTEEYMRANPGVTVQLTLLRAVHFFFINWKLAGVVAILALTGLATRYSDTKVQALVLLVLAYSAPYMLTLVLGYRYRYPIEPLIAALAGLGLVPIWNRLWDRMAHAPFAPT